MSEPTKTPAARLAAVLRVLRPAADFRNLDEGGWLCQAQTGEMLRADSKDDLARVVAMLMPGQRDKFDCHLSFALGIKIGECKAGPSMTLTAPVESWMAALEAAVGVKG